MLKVIDASHRPMLALRSSQNTWISASRGGSGPERRLAVKMSGDE
jgi:hypothetical protein